MLKTLLTLLIFTTVIFQAAGQELVVRQVNGTSVFARNNEILATREVIRLLPDGSKEQRLLRGSRFHGTLAIATAGVGLVYLGVGILRTPEHFEEDPGFDALDQMIIGLGWLGVSACHFQIGKHKARRAVAMFNTSSVPEGPDTGMQFRLGAQPNGLGLALRF
ncbi:hypothetical protein CLV84_0342 [Neolewinella xylanilytica]|uniref:Uncharacterized protein n=1 Tax=Neolewinella xylanilytica TaxID=1514080 RepID=A0A2S6I7B7_9BACT|nr:hypothetical protein [Neolewinella xylanilytica]PPK87402.1 hypothetical protein CLV84_0342 [Neolewinella xylanilytica]